MDSGKSKVVGIAIVVLIVAGALGYYLASKSGLLSSPGKGSSGERPVAAKAQRLEVAPASGYALDSVDLGGEKVPLLRIPLDTWAGYAALFAANGGAKPSKESLFYKKGKFAVEFVRAESAKAQLDGLAAGKYLVLWSSMDSLPLLYDALRADSRVVPQVFGIFDWSTGGDGIVAKSSVGSAKDLRGKTVMTSGNTANNFFLLWYLAQNGISPSEVKMVYLPDGPAAAKAFKADQGIDAWVTWSPFLEQSLDQKSPGYVPGARSLITSGDANQLIADVYFTRRDFAKEHPEMLSAFVQAMMEGADLLAANPEPTYASMAAFFDLPGGAADVRESIKRVHIANFPESRMFFDMENPINAFKIFYMAKEYYKNSGAIPAAADMEAESVVNAKALDSVAAEGLFGDQKNTVISSFNKSSAYDMADLEGQKIVLAQDVEIYFEAQRVDFDLGSSRAEMVQNRARLEKIAEEMAVLGTTMVKLVGHLDTSKVEEYKSKGQNAYVEASAQAKLLSKKRAEFIKKVLVQKYKCDPERIVTGGMGWEQPVDAADPAKNRRVEVRFLSLE